MPCRVSPGKRIYSALITPDFSPKALDCRFENTIVGSWSNGVAAKRLPPNDGQQDFGFLRADENAELADAGVTGPGVETFETLIAPIATPESNVGQPSVTNAPQAAVDAPIASPAQDTHQPTSTSSAPDIAETPAPSTDRVSRRLLIGVAGYAIALTLLFLGLLITGRMSLFGNNALESLPDLRPLAPNEFRKVPDGAELPDDHVLRLGESRRFGDVVVTPVRLSREPLQFQGFLSGAIEEKLTTVPVLKLWLTFENVSDEAFDTLVYDHDGVKLWLTFENVSDDYAFPPFDAGLMSNRTPVDSKDAATLANTFLTIGIPSGDSATTRRLNFLHTMDNNFVIVGQESAKVLLPGESLTTFIASSDEEGEFNAEDSTPFVWRVQFRKGVHVSSGNGVTTLIDIEFSGADVAASG